MKTETELRDELLKEARTFNDEMAGTSVLTKLADFALPYAQRAEAAEAKNKLFRQAVLDALSDISTCPFCGDVTTEADQERGKSNHSQSCIYTQMNLTPH